MVTQATLSGFESLENALNVVREGLEGIDATSDLNVLLGKTFAEDVSVMGLVGHGG